MSRSVERDWRLCADDIVEACRKIRLFIAGMDYDAFVADERTRDAVIRNLEIIGEAAKKLPDEETAKAPQIPWRLVCRMRDGRRWTLPDQMRPSSSAFSTARVRSRTPSLERTLDVWFLIVPSVVFRARAISRLL